MRFGSRGYCIFGLFIYLQHLYRIFPSVRPTKVRIKLREKLLLLISLHVARSILKSPLNKSLLLVKYVNPTLLFLFAY